MRGIPEDARRLSLSHHLRKGVTDHLQTIAAHVFIAQRRALLITNGRQLSGVAHQDQSAPLAPIDEVDEVIEQTSRAIEAPRKIFIIGNHRGLVTDEEQVLAHVVVEREDAILVDGLLTVDALMDGEGRMISIEGKDLGGTSRWSHEHTLAFELFHRPDQRTDKRCFSRSGKTTQDEHRIGIRCEDELTERIDDF